MFSKAIKKDRSYALAYAGLADCHSYLFLYFGGGDAEREKADEASKTALELDPALAEAHASRGLALTAAKRYGEAEKEFDTAILLDPALFEAYYFYARMCFTQGKYEKAVEMYHRAGEVNPEDYQSPSLEAFTYRTMNRMDEAREACARSLETIERHVEFNPDDSRAIYLGATALIDLGQRDRAFEWIRRAEAPRERGTDRDRGPCRGARRAARGLSPRIKVERRNLVGGRSCLLCRDSRSNGAGGRTGSFARAGRPPGSIGGARPDGGGCLPRAAQSA